MDTSTILPPAKRNEKFHLDNIVFLVEGELYRVYAYYFLEASEQIRSLTKINSESSKGVAILLGTCDQYPLALPAITKYEFELLLSLIYPFKPFLDLVDWLMFDWENALAAARGLGMEDLFCHCRDAWNSEFSSMSSAERIFMYLSLGLPEVFIHALQELINRDSTLNDKEASLLGAEKTFRIMQLREQVHVVDKVLHGKPDGVRKAINWTFRAELIKMGFQMEEGTQLDVLKDCANNSPFWSIEERLRSMLKVARLSMREITRFDYNVPIRNMLYYYDPVIVIVIFQVEDELFRVHKEYFVNHSPVFHEMFQIRGQPGQAYLEGKTNENPLHLQGISKSSFEHFLSVIHPIDGVTPTSLERHQWENVIELALLWRMRSLRLYCIKCMLPPSESASFIEKVLISRRYMAQDWLVDAYFKLTQRSAVLSDKEASQLGLASAVSLLRLQARQFKSCIKPQPPNTRTRTKPVTVESVRTTFHDELKRLEDYDSDSEIQ